MAVLEEKISSFLDVGDGSGYGDGYGDGSGYGDGYGDGNGYGSGYGYGNGNGSGSGYGYGDGDGIKSIYGHTIYDIDGVPTAITSLHGNYAKGFTLKNNVIKQPCYIAKVGNYFAHGKTLKEAMEYAQEKYEQNRTLSERIADFKQAYPTLDTEADAADLFRWHNILTGSCLFGRQQFCEQHGVDYEKGKWKIRDFFNLCKNAYGSENIRQAMQAYKQ